MKIITFDIEEWGLVKIGGYGSSEKYAEYDTYLNRILDKLDEKGCKGTFFCIGPMAEFFPHIVKLIASRGHEVGCHSYFHTWMNKLTEVEAREDTLRAVDVLEQCIGMKVLSYRAPAFSIGKENLWMFDILSECGIERDASVFPTNRDLGGFPDFGSECPCIISHKGVELKEFPIPMVNILGKRTAYSGGGYFRFFPLCFVRNEMHKSDYVMMYFHIGDLIPEKGCFPNKEEYEAYYKESGTFKNRYLRYIKSNIGKRGTMEKLVELIESECFVNVSVADSMIDWSNRPHMIL